MLIKQLIQALWFRSRKDPQGIAYLTKAELRTLTKEINKYERGTSNKETKGF